MAGLKNKTKRVLAFTLSLAMALGITMTGGITAHAAGKIPDDATITVTVKNNKKYDLTNSAIKKWLKKNSISAKNVEWWGEKAEKSYPKKVRLTWSTKKIKKSDAQFVVLLSENQNLKNAKKFKTTDKFIELDNLYVDTAYYWKVYVKGKKSVASPIQKFRTKLGFRTINMPGVSNVRDLGGRKVPGGTIRQGLLYRSGALNNVTPEGRKVAVKDLKIKTDFDLRDKNKPDDGVVGPTSPLGSKVRYKNISATQYFFLWRSELDKRVISEEMKVLSNKANYPIDFHCLIGRDRTGTLSFLVGGLLGVSKTKLFQEYELSFFSIDGCAHTATRVGMISNVLNVYNQINKYGGSNDKFSRKTELFLRDMGVSKRTINRIRTILIEKDEDVD